MNTKTTKNNRQKAKGKGQQQTGKRQETNAECKRQHGKRQMQNATRQMARDKCNISDTYKRQKALQWQGAYTTCNQQLAGDRGPRDEDIEAWKNKQSFPTGSGWGKLDSHVLIRSPSKPPAGK